ncbi:Tat pathway signal protein [Paenibacillus sp. DMB20]|uniref:Tat pathway signal protein n=1 Tax=Paenibacillus sp. DMB20 TaxID=1642570 RepID=UPI00128C655A|nr:Tat pathway signal protein [Paenibacillus sp. DMB20]
MKKLHYVMGKSFSNFAVLSIIVVVVMGMAIIMQWIRGEVMQVQLWPLLSPFLFLTLPILSVVSALAVLFETRRALQGVLGNVIYFILFLIFCTGSSYIAFGTNVITSDMVNELASTKPYFSGSYGIGVLIPEQPIELFVWQGVEWTGSLLLQQLSLFLFACLLVLAAALLFPGFQEALEGKKREKKSAETLPSAETGEDPGRTEVDVEEMQERTASRSRVADLPPVTVRMTFRPLLLAEWRLMMKSASFGWYIVAGILAVLCLAMPSTVSSQWMIWPATWIWPLMLWSGIGNRETRFQTQFLVASSPHFLIRQLSAVWVAGILLTCATGSGMLLRLILEGDMERLAYWISAAILIPSLALASGVLTKTNRTFEVFYMIIWYLGPLNKMPVFDFMGTRSIEGMGLNAWAMCSIYIVISIAFLFLAYVSRSRQARSSW